MKTFPRFAHGLRDRKLATLRITNISIVVLALAAAAVGVRAQTRDRLTILEQSDTSLPSCQVVRAVDDLAPNSATGWHIHPGGEMVGYVIQGRVVIEREGRIALSLGAGESFIIPAGVPHNSTNKEPTAARMFVTFFVDKNQPLSAPGLR